MAEAFFNKYAKRSYAESAALLEPQKKMHSLIVRAMSEKGIDISKNKSKKVSDEMIDKADLIVLMSLDLGEHIDVDKEVEIWNVPDIVASEDEVEFYPDFVEARDDIEEFVWDLVERVD